MQHKEEGYDDIKQFKLTVEILKQYDKELRELEQLAKTLSDGAKSSSLGMPQAEQKKVTAELKKQLDEYQKRLKETFPFNAIDEIETVIKSEGLQKNLAALKKLIAKAPNALIMKIMKLHNELKPIITKKSDTPEKYDDKVKQQTALLQHYTKIQIRVRNLTIEEEFFAPSIQEWYDDSHSEAKQAQPPGARFFAKPPAQPKPPKEPKPAPGSQSVVKK